MQADVHELPVPGPEPLGMTLDDAGGRLRVYSAAASGIELCRPRADGTELRTPLERAGGGVWQAFVPGLRHGDRYGLRAHGPAGGRGGRFNPARLLVDPYARAVDGAWSVAVEDCFDWQGDRRPCVPWDRTVVYEAHVRGLTRLHPAVPAPLRGTYAGLAHPAVLEHLLGLGVTTVELLPVHEHRTEAVVAARGLTNYWGYSPVALLAPHGAYAASGSRGSQVGEFRRMVRALHEAGLEVVLDVVFNHSCEGPPQDPAHSLRGLDESAYYWLDEHGRPVDVTGCGNTLDAESPVVQRLVVDALRHWAQEMHVDGFRFDLAVTLGRRRSGFDPDAPLLRAIRDDPLLAGLKLIAEPWDVGHDGYRLGQFPHPFREWNAAYRDSIRDAWRGHGTAESLTEHVLGSPGLFAGSGRDATSGISFVTAHDGHTLSDLVSYEERRNHDNGESNRDGHGDSRAWNCGAEGPSADPAIVECRARRRRGMLATLLLSAGVPMLLAGDEHGRSQLGNTNAYCHDSPLTWLDWSEDAAPGTAAELVRRLTALRRRLVQQREPWAATWARVLLAGPGQPTDGAAAEGELADADEPALVLAFCLGPEDAAVTLPPGQFELLLDSSAPDGRPSLAGPLAGSVAIGAWTLYALARVSDR